jgi:oligoribonuclease NrnB/cAMP/cGMP phosphodiesterase (DHH superfamily)
MVDELQKIRDNEKSYWKTFNLLENEMFQYEKEKNFAKNKISMLEKEIKKFSNINIVNDLFNISYKDKYGTINGARMGLNQNSNVNFLCKNRSHLMK